MISHFNHISIKAIVACVPNSIERNEDLDFDNENLNKVISSSGIEERRVCDEKTTASDLCFAAASHLMKETNTDKNEIGALIFVTQYPDFILPSTAHLLQHRLDLPQQCMVFQLNEGCAGYIYGMSLCCSIMQANNINKALLLVGDTTTKVIEKSDQHTRPLFGDAGSATLLKLEKEAADLKIDLGGDGASFEDIVVKKGSFRHSSSTDLLHMDGMNVFMFGISKVPKYIELFLQNSHQILSAFDFVVLHQANKMMNERIIRKLGIEEEKAIYSLAKFGNTSNASIPLTIAHNLSKKLLKDSNFLASGFGVGLSWATMSFVLNKEVYLELIEL